MENINFFIVFIEGVLSIFSPCILPILPIYLSMLSNSSVDNIKDSNFRSSLLLKNTIFFTLGISTTFFILGSSINALTSFFNTNKNMIMIFGGIIIIIMGLFYLGVIKSELLSREKRLNIKSKRMSPLSAFLLGFTFSFGWTPCIGPILSSVLIMSSTSKNVLESNLLILIYTIGFILPFIIVALFYNKLFEKVDKAKKYMGMIKNLSGIFIIIAGSIMLFNGVLNINKEISANNKNKTNIVEKDIQKSEDKKEVRNSNKDSKENKDESADKIKPIDFTLYDQYGKKHKLSDYKGKTVFLNFWATWCPPCREEMPYIENIYKKYNKNKGDVVILGVSSPNLGREGSKEHIKEFLNKNGHTFPIVFDEGGTMIQQYGISAYPSTFIINKEGYITKYIPGAMNESTMKNIIDNTK